MTSRQVLLLPFQFVLQDEGVSEAFMAHLKQNGVHHFLDFYRAGEAFAKMPRGQGEDDPNTQQLRQAAAQIFADYLADSAPRRVQVAKEVTNRIERIIKDRRYPCKPDLLDPAQQLTYRHLEKRLYPSFALSAQYSDLLKKLGFGQDQGDEAGAAGAAGAAGGDGPNRADSDGPDGRDRSASAASQGSQGTQGTQGAGAGLAVSASGSVPASVPGSAPVPVPPLDGGDASSSSNLARSVSMTSLNAMQGGMLTVSANSLDAHANNLDSMASLSAAIGTGGTWKATLVEAKSVKESVKSYIVYIIKVSHTGVDGDKYEWECARRYSEFDDMHKQLRSRFPKETKLCNLSLPAKKIFGNLDSGFVAKRGNKLADWLQKLTNHVRVPSRSIPPPWGSIRFRLALRTYAPWGVRVVSQAKSRKIPTRKILPLFFVRRPSSSSTPTSSSWSRSS